MPEVEGSGEEVVVVEDSEAVEVSDNVVDDETLLNCHKCLKSSFKYRKDLYCSKCVSKGAISADAVASKKVQCKKCRRTAFRAKNIGYCTDICSEVEEEEEKADTTTAPDAVDVTTEPALGPLETIFKFLVVANTWGTAEAE